MQEESHLPQLSWRQVTAGQGTSVEETGTKDKEWPAHLLHDRLVAVAPRLQPTQNGMEFELDGDYTQGHEMKDTDQRSTNSRTARLQIYWQILQNIPYTCSPQNTVYLQKLAKDSSKCIKCK